MKCEHVLKNGKALQNLATNGRTINPSRWQRGEGIYASKKVRLIDVFKCEKCGHSVPRGRFCPL
jgi:ribosomal protein L32